MIKEVLYLQTYYYGGGQFGTILDNLGKMGFFSYVLPFLLIFAIVYGILIKTKLFEKNAINAIISLSVSLIALQFEVVPIFFANVFPRLGIGLGVILVVIILMGLFMPDKAWVGYVLFGVSALIVIVILYHSFGWGMGYYGSYPWLENYLPLIIGLVFIIVVIALLTSEKKKDNNLADKKLGDVLPFFGYPSGR